MTIPINVEDLQRQRKVDSNRMEFKKGGNPDRIYRSFCAFANDFGNIGGVYNLVATNTDRSIPMSDIQKGQRMVYYYQSCCLAKFLKELSLIEGSNTSIPPLQRGLAHNGYPAITLETDQASLYFLVRIPCHEGDEGVSSAFKAPEANDKEVYNHDKETENYDKEISLIYKLS